MRQTKVEIIQRQNIGELKEAINAFIKNKKIQSVSLSVTSKPVELGLFSDRNYHQYFYACIAYLI